MNDEVTVFGSGYPSIQWPLSSPNASPRIRLSFCWLLNRVLSGTAKSFRFPSREQLKICRNLFTNAEERCNIVIDKVIDQIRSVRRVCEKSGLPISLCSRNLDDDRHSFTPLARSPFT